MDYILGFCNDDWFELSYLDPTDNKLKTKKIFPSLRMRTILKSQTCVNCGLTGNIFRLESNGSNPHLNLYHVSHNKKDVMITCDHIIPKSEGGPNVDENTQVLCERCNTIKGSRIEVKYFNPDIINMIKIVRPVILEGLNI